MRAIAHGWQPSGSAAKIPVSVAKDFEAADKKVGKYERKKAGGRLTTKARAKLPAKTFAGPGRSFPIPDKHHAKAALMLIGKAPASARPKIRARADAMLSKAKGGKCSTPHPW